MKNYINQNNNSTTIIFFCRKKIEGTFQIIFHLQLTQQFRVDQEVQAGPGLPVQQIGKKKHFISLLECKMTTNFIWARAQTGMQEIVGNSNALKPFPYETFGDNFLRNLGLALNSFTSKLLTLQVTPKKEKHSGSIGLLKVNTIDNVRFLIIDCRSPQSPFVADVFI